MRPQTSMKGIDRRVLSQVVVQEPIRERQLRKIRLLRWDPSFIRHARQYVLECVLAERLG